ncbi:Glucose-6-phosphate exchanger [Armadillidium nasatum]|uniref:Glucose-6-phosphate exchanger n=1 Tax=Armadillidium nasatum TaxID=96803 RepID=A0A5N5SL34_9CRUS|nr:Glucose-6-phosphate exchanger [Armadillidium nasatum]
MTSLQTSQIIITITGIFLGASLFGPITIFGIVASESFPSSISGASHAVVALSANVGAIAAGWPFSSLSLMCGWRICFGMCQVLLIVSILVVLLTRKYQQGSKIKEV